MVFILAVRMTLLIYTDVILKTWKKLTTLLTTMFVDICDTVTVYMSTSDVFLDTVVHTPNASAAIQYSICNLQLKTVMLMYKTVFTIYDGRVVL